MRPKVVVTHWIQREVVTFLQEFSEPDIPRDIGGFANEEILRRGLTADALMVCMADLVDARLLDAFPNIRIVAAAVKGANNIDVEECTRRRIWVTVCPDLLTAPTAELAVGMMIGLGRRVNEAQRVLREGFRGWRPQLLAPGLVGRSAGLVGMGRLGRAVAKRLHGFDMRVFYHDLKPLTTAEEKEFDVNCLGFNDLLAHSDYVILLIPLTDETRNMIDKESISIMRSGSMLINCARGSVVDEMAVAHALKNGHLAGYAADVFSMEDQREEGRPAEIPHELLEESNKVILTPHIGSALIDVRKRISLSAAEQIKSVFQGKKPELAINSIDAGEWNESGAY